MTTAFVESTFHGIQEAPPAGAVNEQQQSQQPDEGKNLMWAVHPMAPGPVSCDPDEPEYLDYEEHERQLEVRCYFVWIC